MSMASMRLFFLTLGSSLRRALETRMLVLWLLALGLPTILLALPMYALIAPHLNYAPDAQVLATHIDVRTLIDLPGVLFTHPEAFTAATISSLLVAALVTTWLNGLAVGAFRVKPRAGFGVLISAANSYYWRMLRMGLWSVVPVGIVLAVMQGLLNALQQADQRAVVESSTELLHLAHFAVTLLLYGLAQCSVETARALMAIDPRRRSVVKSWFHAVGMLVRHPLSLFFVFALPSVGALLIAAVLMILRVNVDQGSAIGLVVALLLAELIALILAVMRMTRLFAVAERIMQIRNR